MKANKNNIMHQVGLTLIAALVCSIAVMGGDIISSDKDILDEAVIHDVNIGQTAEDVPATNDALIFHLLPDDTINWQVISEGATEGSSEQYLLYGTIGQPTIGIDSNSIYLLRSGYWQFFCDCKPGDANGNGSINLLDISHIINYLYKGGPSPTPYELCAGDADCSCALNILDVTYLVSFLYKGGDFPCKCEGWISPCGQPLRK